MEGTILQPRFLRAMVNIISLRHVMRRRGRKMSQHENTQLAPFTLGPEETDTACLLIHGFGGTSAEMRGLGEALAGKVRSRHHRGA